MKENSKIIRFMEKADIIGQMEKLIKVHGSIIKWKVKVSFIGRMAEYIRGNL